MPEIDMPDWSKEQEDFRVIEATGTSLGIARGDVIMVFRRVDDAEFEEFMAAGSTSDLDDDEPSAGTKRRPV
jgi:hypothetical protein